MPERVVVIDGGPCEYDEIMGKATITKIEKTSDFKRTNEVEVYFDFIANDKDNDEQNDNKDRKLTVHAGSNPRLSCLEKQNIIVGSTHDCIKKTITKGTCSPIIFLFIDFDESDC